MSHDHKSQITLSQEEVTTYELHGKGTNKDNHDRCSRNRSRLVRSKVLSLLCLIFLKFLF